MHFWRSKSTLGSLSGVFSESRRKSSLGAPEEICLLGVVCKVLNIGKHCLVKHFAMKIKFCALSNLLFFYELLIGPHPTFLEFIVIFL